MIELALALERRLLADVSRGREQLRRLFKDRGLTSSLNRGLLHREERDPPHGRAHGTAPQGIPGGAVHSE